MAAKGARKSHVSQLSYSSLIQAQLDLPFSSLSKTESGRLDEGNLTKLCEIYALGRIRGVRDRKDPCTDLDLVLCSMGHIDSICIISAHIVDVSSHIYLVYMFLFDFHL